MMKMDADVVAMTMPDINNYHIKRSYIRKDIEYVYIPHGIDSPNLTMRKGSMDNYDSVFVTGKYQREECEKTNQVYNLKSRKIINLGYPLLDEMITDYKKSSKKTTKKKTIMIAPSWQKDNIIDLCLDQILDSLKGENYQVIVRPHPQHVRHMKEMFNKMQENYQDTNIIIQTDFSSTDSVFNADLLITDWSSIGYEYAFTTEKPVISIDTPMKIMNPEYKKIKVEPFNIWARSEIGEVVKVGDVKNINKTVQKILKDPKKYQKKIATLKKDSMYNLGNSAKVGAEYIIQCVQDKIKERKKK
ncbi:CDP-glycerol glycerophosphotransferase family protein, partial [Candidatus Saccharibacteria bacterium]|nr:CDP-glycerol glycerophosphotransferase family protein [Candidatus Saccharibacteria bacterium]